MEEHNHKNNLKQIEFLMKDKLSFAKRLLKRHHYMCSRTIKKSLLFTETQDLTLYELDRAQDRKGLYKSINYSAILSPLKPTHVSSKFSCILRNHEWSDPWKNAMRVMKQSTHLMRVCRCMQPVVVTMFARPHVYWRNPLSLWIASDAGVFFFIDP